jgi:hypothetical protein
VLFLAKILTLFGKRLFLLAKYINKLFLAKESTLFGKSEFERNSVKSTISNKLNLEYNLANWLKPKLGLGLGLGLSKA